jgi:molybdopterin/thiamine biosynthesis adenylyltransferase
VGFDAVDLFNIVRQILHTTADVGRPKITSASESCSLSTPS